MAQENEAAFPFVFVGNRLCLDFINTEIPNGAARIELLPDAGSVLRWLRAANALPEEKEGIPKGVSWGDAGLKTEAERAGFHAQALALRAAGRRLVEGTVAQTAPDADALQTINEALRHHQGWDELIVMESEFVKRFHAAGSDALSLLVPIAASLCDLLCTGDLSLLKKCENPDCIRYYYDTTRSHTRRWCSMSGCGNRHKAAQHYRRHKHAGG